MLVEELQNGGGNGRWEAPWAARHLPHLDHWPVHS